MVASFTYEGHLSPKPPYAFEHSLAYHTGTPPAIGMAGATPLTDALLLGDRPVAWQIRSPGKVESPFLTYTLFSPLALDPATIAAAIAQIRFYLSLDDDLQPFYTLAWADDPCAAVVDRLYGYHQVKTITPFAAAVWALFSQRTARPEANRQLSAFIAQFGPTITVGDRQLPAFPTAARVAATSLTDLDFVGGRRASYLHAAARAFAGVEDAWLLTAPTATLWPWLLALDGIGAWSAALILRRGLGRSNATISCQRKGLLAAIQEVYGPDAGPNPIDSLGRHYGAWQGYLADYLCFNADVD